MTSDLDLIYIHFFHSLSPLLSLSFSGVSDALVELDDLMVEYLNGLFDLIFIHRLLILFLSSVSDVSWMT